MPRLTINAQDLKRAVVLDQGWYNVEVTSVEEKESKAGDSMNIIVEMVGLSSTDSDKNKAAGVPLRRYFSEKAPGMAASFIKACIGNLPEEGGDFELSGAVGKKLQAFVKPRQFEGRMSNDVVDFKSIEE